MNYATIEKVKCVANIVDLSGVDLDMVNVGIRVSWSNQSTNWGSVLAWGVGGAVAGSAGGWAGAGLGALGGAGADYVSQHLSIELD